MDDEMAFSLVIAIDGAFGVGIGKQDQHLPLARKPIDVFDSKTHILLL